MFVWMKFFLKLQYHMNALPPSIQFSHNILLNEAFEKSIKNNAKHKNHLLKILALTNMYSKI